MLNFDNRFVRELPGDPDRHNTPRQVFGACWSPVTPTPVAAPVLLAHSREVAAALDLDDEAMATPAMLAALAGNTLLPGMVAYATCYGGHQFGQWAGQLGDGRAILLGEAINRSGQRFELQLKGAGPTPYARRADGRAVLRSSLREFLCSEAMHHLGVPTTRALSLVGSGETVVRDMFYDGHSVAEPGAVVCRVAPSFIRFGHFELLAARGERQLLQRLVDFTIARDFPELAGLARQPEQRLATWFTEVCERTARLMAHWLRVGFVHGVMNTDNMSILGLTLDYGPYGWVDNFDPGWTPNTTDAASQRYCFARQPEIARWNLERLAAALATLGTSADDLAAAIARYDVVYSEEFCTAFAGKLGLLGWTPDDGDLLDELCKLMRLAEIDMSIFFRQLAQLDINDPQPRVLQQAFYRDELRQQFSADLERWLARYAARLRLDGQTAEQRRLAMNQRNPRFVLRNYLAQQAIDRAEQGDTGMLHDLLEILRRPYDEQPGRAAFSARRPDWARHKAGCSMLSCSS
ncbi:protein adenylyltransferase SelO [Candidatus Accumulibacter sp. ACC003]|uniref:protein adenylyltransferase SelO n=1 Tax=Candidatus Accumulibacter sp. ACC003 TaxID=2823334 RepID=UPI0025BA00B4|nr:YdiU family protein [Candidatus Accumulibacter sp. ACC003]